MAVLSVALLVTTFGWIAVSMKLAAIEDQFHQYQLSSRQEISDSENQAAEIERLKAEKEILVKGVIPGLRLLEFDSTITIDDQYFRNIGFTLTGTSQYQELRISYCSAQRQSECGGTGGNRVSVR